MEAFVVSLEAAIVPSSAVTLEMASASHMDGCPWSTFSDHL